MIILRGLQVVEAEHDVVFVHVLVVVQTGV